MCAYWIAKIYLWVNIRIKHTYIKHSYTHSTLSLSLSLSLSQYIYTYIYIYKQPKKDYHQIKPYVRTTSPFTRENEGRVLLRLKYWPHCLKNQLQKLKSKPKLRHSAYNTQKFIHRCPQGHMVQWIKALVRSSDIPKKSASSIPCEGSGVLSEGKLTDNNW